MQTGMTGLLRTALHRDLLCTTGRTLIAGGTGCTARREFRCFVHLIAERTFDR
jgi:hypothetical protein